jgi:hypothetical protein
MLKDIRFFEDVRLLFIIGVAACVVDTAGLFVWKRYPSSAAISKWYDTFGLLAYMLDVSSVFIGVVLAQFITAYIGGPWNPLMFCAAAVGVQQVHDLLFATVVVPAVPSGTNDVMDLMREYVGEKRSWLVLVADAVYVILASLLAMVLYGQKTWVSVVTLVMTLYVTGYAIVASPGR